MSIYLGVLVGSHVGMALAALPLGLIAAALAFAFLGDHAEGRA